MRALIWLHIFIIGCTWTTFRTYGSCAREMKKYCKFVPKRALYDCIRSHKIQKICLDKRFKIGGSLK